jgi:hypothetical protein
MDVENDVGYESSIDDMMDASQANFEKQIEEQSKADESKTTDKPEGEPVVKEELGAASDQQLEPTNLQAEEEQKPITAKPDEPASSEGEEQAETGALTESLKPYQTLLESRKWKGSIEDLPKILESYSEMEKSHGSKGREIGLLNTRNQETSQAALGNLEAINAYRTAQGQQPIRGAQSAQEQFTATKEVREKLNAALNNDATATEWLVSHFDEQFSDLQYAARREAETLESNPGNLQSREATTIAKENLNSLQNQNPNSDIEKTMNSIWLDPVYGPLLDSQQLNIGNMFSSTERTQGWHQLASEVQAGREAIANDKARESSFTERVNAEVEKRMNHKQENKNGGAGGQNSPAGNSETGSAEKERAKEASEMMMDFAGLN